MSPPASRTAWFAANFALAVLVVAASPAFADLSGRAGVTDGDTLTLQGQRVRLHGIDAPESSQLCEAEGKQYRCGQKAALALADLLGSRTVSCNALGRDRYGRILAVCTLGDTDINRWMVANGHALAFRRYSDAYAPDEDTARNQRRGVWQGEFTPPWEWRSERRAVQAKADMESFAAPTPHVSARPSAGKCLIKGNINAKGARIYHMPGSHWYDRTGIATERGERWFCSEGEARAAGWRAPRD